MPRSTFNDSISLGAKVSALLCAGESGSHRLYVPGQQFSGTMHLLPLLACIPNFQFVLRTTDVASLWSACELIRAPECGKFLHSASICRLY